MPPALLAGMRSLPVENSAVTTGGRDGGANPVGSGGRAAWEAAHGANAETDPVYLEDSAPASDEDGPPLDVILAEEGAESSRELEPVRPRVRVQVDEVNEVDESKPLPPLDDLVSRIPAEVKECLEDLFRARFVKVTRVPSSALSLGAKPEVAKS